MLKVNVKEARNKLSSLLDKVETGEEVVITRRGNSIAKLVPIEKNKQLPSLHEFRAKIRIKKGTLSQTVIKSREEERY